MKKDNAGKNTKYAIREMLLAKFPEPRILEAYGGKGELGKTLYASFTGVVFEKDEKKTPHLVEQRPHWAVYEGDCVKAIAAGIGFHHAPNFFDVDPYGSPWPAIRAIFSNADILPDVIGIVVNDGLRRAAMLGRSWKVEELAPYAQRLGNQGVHEQWPNVVRDIFDGVALQDGFEIKEWAIKSSGYGGQMTHYAAVVERAR